MDCRDKQFVDMLKKLQEMEFIAVELNLYLDTHPCDCQALEHYNRCVYEIRQLRAAVEAVYGPLTNFGYAPSQYPWKWIETPWPWEIEY